MAGTALLMLVAATVAMPRITATPIGDARWRLTISVVGNDVDTALPRLATRAQQLCRNKTPTFGKYRFKAPSN